MLIAQRVPSRHSSCSSAPDLSERERLAERICDMIDRTVEIIPGLDRQDGRAFLTKYDLHRILDFASLRQLFKEFFKQNPNFLSPILIVPQAPSTNEQATEPTLQSPNNEDTIIDAYVKATTNPSRKALLALLLYQKHKALLTVFMRWPLPPNPNTPTDESLPLSISGWEALGIKRTYCREIVQAQPMFRVACIRENQHLDVNINERLPFIETLADAKRGSSGTVQTTKIARGHWEIVINDGTSFGNLDAPKTIAVKTFKENATRNMDETTKDFNTEHGILKELKRDNVRHKMIMLDSGSFTIFTESGTPLSHALIFEPASFNLADFLMNQHRADVYSTKSILLASLTDVVDAVACLHDNLDVLHLDIKPDNILVFERGASHPDNQAYDQLVFKISDFGLARKIGTRPRKGHNDIEPSLNPSRSSATSGTRPAGVYQGPEIQETNSSRAGRGSDVWSLGCVTLMMLAFMLYGSSGVHKLKSRLEVEFLGNDGDQSLFYIRSDSYPWEKGDVEQTPYRYLQDFKPVTGPVPNNKLDAAVNPRVIEWSNVLGYERAVYALHYGKFSINGRNMRILQMHCLIGNTMSSAVSPR
ncbi:kinase-like domain-containing protein [Boeremia exigua]|uniref:kinase-like domain-containing protein n=1 Tax=Boeremia exigua TaxID=749465 RepID=UPI001E8DF339|nr:kinase-like domain-containing protein [Boeremia exigua]KAH6629839.1 kinase-like domain-containing protein [Boeremia exigua]